MDTNKTEKSIGIYFSEVSAKERKIFERVIAFDASHGLKAHFCNEIKEASIIIANESHIPEQTSSSSILLVISKDKSLGDIQIAPPLLITRVMKAVEKAIKLVDGKTPSTEQEAQSTETATPDKQQHNYHALVIDDSASIRKQLELELRDAGITCDFAESGEQALEKIENNSFDIVFLDIIMPGMDGYETCKAMRATIEYKKTPIIMLSGKSSPLDEVEGVISGATCYLTKPVKSDMLQQTLNRVTKWIDNFSETKKEETA